MDESLSESHLKDIREGKDRDAGSMKTLFTTHWRSLLLVFLITAGGTVAFYTYSVNAPAIVKSTFGADRAMTATWINLLGLIFLLLLQPVGGIISDRVGRKPLLIFFGVGGVIYTYILLTFLPQTTSALMAFALTGRRLRHPHRLHLGQRDREGGAVPRRHPCPGRGAGLRARELRLRRHGAAAVPSVQVGRSRHAGSSSTSRW